MLRCIVAFRHCRAAKYLYHSYFGAANFVNNGMSVRVRRSTCPLALGTPVVIKECSIFLSRQYFPDLFDVNAVPLSEIIRRGLQKIAACFLRRTITSAVPADLVTYNHVNFEKASITANIYWYDFLVEGRGPKWSICNVSKGTILFSIEFNKPVFHVFSLPECMQRNFVQPFQLIVANSGSSNQCAQGLQSFQLKNVRARELVVWAMSAFSSVLQVGHHRIFYKLDHLILCNLSFCSVLLDLYYRSFLRLSSSSWAFRK